MNKIFLIGDKLCMRPLERSDLDGPYGAWINDPEVVHFLASGAFPVNYDELVLYFEAHVNNRRQILFAIIEKETEKHIGNARIYNIDWINRNAHRGIMIGDKLSWGKGYGLEIINLISEYAFNTLGLNKLMSSTVSDNKGIMKVNERAAYKQEGCLREAFYRDGKYYDAIYWGLLKSDYLSRGKEPDTK